MASRLIAVGAAGTVVLAIAGAWLWRSVSNDPAAPAMRVVPLTAMSGSEYGGAFSPDGRQVAFAWNGEAQDNRDIYVKLVGSSEVRRLTTDPGIDLAPAWSPDGRQIAYARLDRPYHSQVRVMSSLGGSDRKVSDFHDLAAGASGLQTVDTWWQGARARPRRRHPANGIYLIPVQGGEPRAITRPRAPGVDQSPAFSPDGRRLAYASCHDEWRGECDVQVLDLDCSIRRGRCSASAHRPARHGQEQHGLEPATARFVIFNAEEVQLRLPVAGWSGRRAPSGAHRDGGRQCAVPDDSPTGDRLAFSPSHSMTDDIYRFEPGRAARPVARSSVFDGSPQFSPDGRRIAFCSLRSGDAMEVWVANADGSHRSS